ASFQEMNSDYTFEDKDNTSGNYVLNSTYSNVFLYKEKVTAVYANVNKDFKKINVQIGLRGENTIIDAVSKTNSITYSRKYFNLFPMMSVEYKISDNHNLQFSCNKRINRPDYNNFNPFRTVKNILNVSVGNPYLRPEYSNS